MIDCSNARIDKLIIHFIGSKANNEGFSLSDESMEITDERLNQRLTHFFTKSYLKREDQFTFTHINDLELNDTYVFSKTILKEEKKFESNSRKLAKHLYECSSHGAIKAGELIIVMFENVVIKNQKLRALGIFKSESKDTILKVLTKGTSQLLKPEEGIGANNLEKGCLILDSENVGFTVLVNDNLKSQGEEATFWKDDFLKIAPVADNYYFTNTALEISKNFIKERVIDDFDVTKTDQIGMLNKSVKYFKENSSFNFDDFSQKVFETKDRIQAFQNYRDEVYSNGEFVYEADNFEIAESAVKHQSKNFKSVITLDENIQIIIKGNQEMIERGFDQKLGLSFYKILFKEEKP